MEINLLTRKYKGVFISITHVGIAIYLNLPHTSIRFFWQWKNGFRFRRWDYRGGGEK